MTDALTTGSPGLNWSEELSWYWKKWPGKALWLSLAVAWVALFQWLGNSTFGYIDTASLFQWMSYCYNCSPDDEHGYFVPLVVLLLFWWKRRELLASIQGVWWPALGLLLLAIVLHVLAYTVQQTRVSILAFYLGLYALLGLVWGRRFMLASSFPMILFVFAVPLSTISASITLPLRILVAKISVWIGQYILAMPITRVGSQIMSGHDSYDVAPACSGIRSLTVLGGLTMVYAFMRFQSPWRRCLVLLSAFPIAVIGNVARITALLILGDVFGQAQAMRLEQYLGLITFTVALICLFALGAFLERGERAAPPPPVQPTFSRFSPWPALVAVLVLFAGTAAALAHLGAGHKLGKPGLKLLPQPSLVADGKTTQTNSVYLPPDVPGYSSKAIPITDLEVNWLPKDTLFGRRLYQPLAKDSDVEGVQASVVLMGTDRTSIHKPQYCLEGQGWRIEKTETEVVPISRPYPYELRVMKLTSFPRYYIEQTNGPVKAGRGIYVYWFVADGELTPYHGQRMWWMARDLLRTGVLQRWAYVSYFTICPPGKEDAAFARLKDLIAASVPEFQLATGPRVPLNTTASVSAASSERVKN